MTEPFAPFKAPFRYDVKGAGILDDAGNLVTVIRGAGFLASVTRGQPAGDIILAQDRIGAEIVEAMNDAVRKFRAEEGFRHALRVGDRLAEKTKST